MNDQTRAADEASADPNLTELAGVFERTARSGTAPWPAESWSEDPAGWDREFAEFQRGTRSDAGTIRLSARDVAALLLVGEIYGVQTDLLEHVLSASGDAVRQVTMRWRKAGLVETARLGPVRAGAG